ncbi:MAG: M23 family metallopeptidase [Desulfobacteraceae bacterium]|nr:M23 family metallopeptidase [Desulfobacteraceae bacterium]
MASRKKQRGKGVKYLLGVVLGALVLGALIWLVMYGFEGGEPRVRLELKDKYISAVERIQAKAWDDKSGIRRIRALVVQEESEAVLMDEKFPKGTASAEEMAYAFTLEINIRETGLSEGEALLRIEIWDHSWRNMFSGNRLSLEEKLVVDLTAPHIEVLTRQHNVSQGGAGLITYRLSEECSRHGVSVDGHFFPGYSGYFDDPGMYIAFFGLAHDQDTDVDMRVEAEDLAGNTGRSGFPYYLRARHFNSETLRITDRFLRNILPEFENAEGFPKDEPPVEQFLFVNRGLRKKNNQTMLSVAKETEHRKHWHGDFLRLPNSARKSGFADRRTYEYAGKKIDRQVHMGIDLASVRQAPVPAANAGRVAFVGRVGIYGNVVIIDHGFGLFSVYAHLSRSDVSEGDAVEKADIIGTTGTTGLAGGDHLHYGMFINDIFVNPVEWWDSSWIENNVTKKLDRVRELTSGR